MMTLLTNPSILCLILTIILAILPDLVAKRRREVNLGKTPKINPSVGVRGNTTATKSRRLIPVFNRTMNGDKPVYIIEMPNKNIDN